MAKPSESAKHAYTYIPPAVQKSMADHMQKTLPGHLQKYQQGSGHIPSHVGQAMSEHMQKTMPGHMKKYVNPYLDQNVINSRPGQAGTASATPLPNRPVGRAAKVRGLSSNNQDDNLFAPDQPAPSQPESSSAAQPQQQDSKDPYGFIMNPAKPPRQPLFSMGSSSMMQKVLILGGGFISLIILFSLASSLLNGASNAQKDRLLSLASSQAEIIRMADAASEKLSDKDLLYKASTVKVTVESSQKDVLAAITSRGKKIKDNDIEVQDPANDAALSEGEQNNRFDQAYSELLAKQLDDYGQLLQQVYDSGNQTEKDLAIAAADQLKLLAPPTTQQ